MHAVRRLLYRKRVKMRFTTFVLPLHLDWFEEVRNAILEPCGFGNLHLACCT